LSPTWHFPVCPFWPFKLFASTIFFSHKWISLQFPRPDDKWHQNHIHNIFTAPQTHTHTHTFLVWLILYRYCVQLHKIHVSFSLSLYNTTNHFSSTRDNWKYFTPDHIKLCGQFISMPNKVIFKNLNDPQNAVQ
jgi:hypothetical protein